MEKGVPQSFMGLCKEYFGFKPGQSLFEFRDELKQLTDQDRKDLKEAFEKEGYTIKE